MVQKVQKTLNWVLVISCISHIFCCGLPIIAGIVGVGLTFGLISVQLSWLEQWHAYEHVLLAFSAGALIFIALIQWISYRLDCRKTGCHHPPCDSKKAKSSRLFYISLTLFVVNFSMHILDYS